MRKFFLLTIAILPFFEANSQSILFSFTDNTEQSYVLGNTRKSTFSVNAMNLHLIDGTVYSWNLSTMKHYTYNEGLVTSLDGNAGSKLAPMSIYPNPTTGQLAVNYTLDVRMLVSLEVLDLQGRLVQHIELGTQEVGAHIAKWDGLDNNGHAAKAGTYLCRIITPRVQMSRTFIIQ
jgi:hypothetical protein